MEKKRTVFDFLEQIFFVFGITVTCLCVFAAFFGEGAKEVSTIFAFGKAGLSIATLVQFLSMAALITIFEFLFFSDTFIKKWTKMKRIIGLFITIIAVIACFSGIFGWFAFDEVVPWILFFACFIVSGAISVYLTALKEKKENNAMQEALLRLQNDITKGEK